MNAPTPPQGPKSPWHAGEVALQRLVGSEAQMAAVGPRVIRRFMPGQHRSFFAELPFIVLGSMDAQLRPWTSVLAGAPGFIRSPDDTHLVIDAPGAAALPVGSPVGMLGIQPHTRRRNRANGVVEANSDDALAIRVRQSFGNCPRYITRREAVFVDDHEDSVAPEHLSHLDPSARELVANADTFFVTSYVQHDDGRIDVDVSHRGGPPGFVQVGADDTLTIPDYAGNNFFNTLGNFVSCPLAGLLFVDFDSGDALQLTGAVTLHLEQAAPGAARHWSVTPSSILRRRRSVPLKWRTESDNA